MVLVRWEVGKVGKYVFALAMLIAQVCTTEAFIATKLRIPTRCRLLLSARPVTYTAVKCPWKPESQLLVKDSDQECLQHAKLFSTENFEVASGKSMVNEWIKKGAAFWADDDGLASLHASEQQKSEKNYNTGMNWDGVGQYINIGTDSDPVYMKKSMYYQKAQAGLIRKGIQDSEFVQELVNCGEAFTDLEHLFRAERQANRALDIALRLKANYSITSPEWQRWTNYTEKTNSTSLLQAIGHYFAEHSIADVGLKEGSGYVPKRGYVGTLAPGETYPDAYPIETHPKKILHPWPAFQQIPMHVRWPSNHPLIPNYLLFLAQNNMLLLDEWDEITKMLQAEWLEETGQQAIVWGSDEMLGLDAHRIATEAAIGRCYLPEEQIPHGGMVFDYGEKIPFYNPDHGPTREDWQVDVDIPPRLRSLVEKWPSPYKEIDATLYSNEQVVGDAQRADQVNEEERRRAAVQQLLEGVDVNPYKNNVEFALDPGPNVPAWMTDDPTAEANEIERRVQSYLESYYARRAQHELARENAALTKQQREAPPELQYAGPPRQLQQEYVQNDEVVGEYSQEIDFNMLRARFKHEIKGERILQGNRQGRVPSPRPRLQYMLDSLPIEQARYQEDKMWDELGQDGSLTTKSKKQEKKQQVVPQELL